MRKNPPARWVLPDVVDPVARKCIQIQVPDDPAHIAAFRGALLALASGYNWSDDPTHKAKDVAKVWRDILDNTFDWGCGGLQTKLRVDDICTLSWSYDDWVTFDSYDPSGCILANIDSVVPGMINQAILDALQNGQIQGGTGQQGPQSAPDNGSCRTYHVRMNAKDQWLCPSPIGATDTILFGNATGGASDGSLAWYCPDGARYLFGACSEGLKTHVSGDPLNPGAYHMALIGNFNGVYFDALTQEYVVPSGSPSGALTVQVNDNSLSDNTGEYEFDVTVCTGGVSWCHHFDFRTSDGGFSDPNNAGRWEPGEGWQTWYSNGYHGVFVKRDWGYSSKITRVRGAGTSPDNASYAVLDIFCYTPTRHDWVNQTTTFPDNWTFDNVYTLNDAHNLYINTGATATYTGYFTVSDLWVYGQGVNPFGSSNC